MEKGRLFSSRQGLKKKEFVFATIRERRKNRGEGGGNDPALPMRKSVTPCWPSSAGKQTLNFKNPEGKSGGRKGGDSLGGLRLAAEKKSGFWKGFVGELDRVIAKIVRGGARMAVFDGGVSLEGNAESQRLSRNVWDAAGERSASTWGRTFSAKKGKGRESESDCAAHRITRVKEEGKGRSVAWLDWGQVACRETIRLGRYQRRKKTTTFWSKGQEAGESQARRVRDMGEKRKHQKRKKVGRINTEQSCRAFGTSKGGRNVSLGGKRYVSVRETGGGRSTSKGKGGGIGVKLEKRSFRLATGKKTRSDPHGKKKGKLPRTQKKGGGGKHRCCFFNGVLIESGTQKVAGIAFPKQQNSFAEKSSQQHGGGIKKEKRDSSQKHRRGEGSHKGFLKKKESESLVQKKLINRIGKGD